MSKHLYKQYLRLVSKWPKDANKSIERDFAQFLSRDVERQFKDPGKITSLDIAACQRRYQALEQLLNNEVIKKYPNSYTSGVFGLKLADLQLASSETCRKQMGLKPKVGVFKKIWTTIVPQKK